MTREEYLALANARWDALEQLKHHSNFYDYEKEFEQIWLDLGRAVLEKNLSEIPKDRRKKKVQTRFGQIELNNSHAFNAFSHGFCVSPLLQEQCVFAGTLDVYGKIPEVIQQFLRLELSVSQGYRLTNYYGEQANYLIATASPALAVSPGQAVFAEMDGGMIYTDNEWQEVKVGRVFRAEDIQESPVAERGGTIKHSEYTAHLGNCHEFTEKMRLTTDKYAYLGALLVFIVDGATWMRNWITRYYPNATQILDFYHAAEHIAEFATLVFENKKERTDWIEQQKALLLESQVQKVMDNIKGFKQLSKQAKENQNQLISYCQNNEQRMNYKEFRQKGFIIGSGAIESAHRTVIQKRMKLSGQRWANKGAEKIINLRVAYMSNKWEKVVDLIKYPTVKLAA